jgi:hypothetical protein
MSRLLLLSSLIILGVGCVSLPRASEPALPLGHQGGEPLMVKGAYITGPSSSLVVSDNALRGRFRDLPVSLAWSYQEVTGMVAERPTRLELAEGDDMRVWGSFAGAPLDVILVADWVTGRVGECSYALKKREEGGYTGKRDCGGVLEGDFDLAFPAPLQQRPLGEKATLLALMLVNHTLSHPPAYSVATFAKPRQGSSFSKGDMCWKQ